MSFSLSGSTITQSGTDANLSGLASVSGVTVVTRGTNTIYDLGDRNLVVTGSLTIDPEIEELLFGTAAPYPMVGVDATGTLQIGFELDVGGTAARYSAGTWARFSRESASTSTDAESALRIETGGTLEWFGGAMFCKAMVSFMTDSNVTVYSPQAQIIWQVNNEIRQLRMLSSLADIRGLVTKGGFVTFISNPTNWSGWSPFDAYGNQALSFSTTSPSNVFYELRDFNPAGMDPVQHSAVWANKWGRLINGTLGSAVVIGGNSDNSSNNVGLYEIRQELDVNVLSFSNSSVADTKIYMQDTNNGGRLAANQIDTNPDYVANRTYTHTFDSSGTHTFDTDGGILTAVIHRQTGGLRFDNFTYDRRSVNNDATDTFRQIFCSYLYNIGVFDTSLVSIGGTTLDATLFDDELITETSKAVVDAYTELDTAAKAYDRLKSFLYDNFAGEVETIVTREGNTLNCRSLDVVIDATASQVVDLTGNTLTIRATSFNDEITTSGTVTTVNGADINGLVNGVYQVDSDETIGAIANNEVIEINSTLSTLAITLDGITPSEIRVVSATSVTVSGINNAKAPAGVTTITEQNGGTITLSSELVPSPAYVEDLINNTITLQATFSETSLEGMQGLQLVDYEIQGSLTIYNTSARLITIGDLIIDADVETLVFNPDTASPCLDYRGELQIGRKTTSGGITRFSSGDAIIINRISSSDSQTILDGGICSTVSGSSFIGFGGRIVANSPVSLCGNTSTQHAGTVLIEKLDYFARVTTNGDAVQFRLDNTLGQSVNISGLSLNCDAANVTGRSIILFATDYTSFSAEFLAYSLQSFISSDVSLEFNDLQFLNNFRPVDLVGNTNTQIRNAPTYTLVNTDIGTSTATSGDPAPNRRMNWEYVQDLSISLRSNNMPITEDQVVYLTETDDGNRFEAYLTRGSDDPSQEWTVVREYLLPVNGSGIASGLIRTGVKRWRGDDPTSLLQESFFGKNTDDEFDLFTIGYRYAISQRTETLRGNGGTSIVWDQPIDLSITETDRSVVDAYPVTVNLIGSTLTVTGNNSTLQTLSARQLYDIVKSYLVDNYSGETETIVAREGNTVNCRDLDVLVSFITFNPNDLIQTTGNVLLQNGSTANFIDASADSFFSFNGIDSWEVYASQADANTQSNLLSSGLVSDNYRFNFTPSTSYFFRLTIGSETFFRTETPQASGETVVDLSQTSLQISQTVTLDKIDAQLGFIEKIIYVNTALAQNGDGSNQTPFNNIDDAVALFNSDSYSRIDLRATIAAPATANVSLAGVTITSSGGNSFLNVNGQSANFAYLQRLNLSGGQDLTDAITTYDVCSFVDSYTGITGELSDCTFLTLTGANQVIGINGSTILRRSIVANASDVTFNLTSSNIAVAFRAIQGDFIIGGADNTTMVSIDAFAGKLTVDNTCFGPNIRVYDTVDITDQSTDGLVDVRDLPTASQIYAEFTAGNNADAFKADTTTLATTAQLGAAETSILNAITALNNLSAADVKAQADQALVDYDGPTKAELDAVETAILSAISGLNDVDAAIVAETVWNYLQSNTTVSGSLKEAVEITLRNARLIPATV